MPVQFVHLPSDHDSVTLHGSCAPELVLACMQTGGEKPTMSSRRQKPVAVTCAQDFCFGYGYGDCVFWETCNEARFVPKIGINIYFNAFF